MNSTGTYAVPVTYAAADIDACNQSETSSILINVKAGPVSDFNWNDPACLSDTIRFTGTPVTGAFQINNYSWYFADNSTAGTPNISKRFSSAGNQDIRYRIFSSTGCIGDTTKTITIHTNPVADFTVSGMPFCTGKEVTIHSASAGISHWNWELGNGSSNAVPPFTHIYPAAGTYTLSLVVASAAGCFSEPVQQIITVNSTPVVNAGTDTTIRAGTSLTLNAAVSPAGNYNYTWTPSIYLSSSAVQNPMVTPLYSTRYDLLAADPVTGCFATDDVMINAVAGLFIPTGFTPNGDGINDQWTIPGLVFYPDARVLVFNRGGQKLYEAGAYISHPWDGRFHGTPQPAGVYVYIIELKDDGKRLLKGTLTLIR